MHYCTKKVCTNIHHRKVVLFTLSYQKTGEINVKDVCLLAETRARDAPLDHASVHKGEDKIMPIRIVITFCSSLKTMPLIKLISNFFLFHFHSCWPSIFHLGMVLLNRYYLTIPICLLYKIMLRKPIGTLQLNLKREEIHKEIKWGIIMNSTDLRDSVQVSESTSNKRSNRH